MKFHWESVQTIANMEDPTAGLEEFVRFLQFWWCQKYNRPLKDPLLSTYTINELLYEYLRYYYSIPENDPRKQLEAKQVQSEEDEWIRAQLMKVQEAQKAIEQVSQEISAKTADKDAEKKTDETRPLGEMGDKALPPAIPELPDISTKFDE
jgi:hypothetical protein